MDVNHFHNSVYTILAVMLIVESVYVQRHPTIAQDVVEPVIVLPDQLSKEDVLLLGFRNRPVQPFIIGSSCNIQLLTHPSDTPALALIEILNCYVPGLESDPS
jgi:hypothetical protein